LLWGSKTAYEILKGKIFKTIIISCSVVRRVQAVKLHPLLRKNIDYQRRYY